VASFIEIVRDYGVPPPNLAIAWCLLNKNVSTVILGASNLEQLNDNLKAAEVAPLFTEELKQRLDNL